MSQQAPTYTPSDAITYVQNLVHGIPVTAVQYYACDVVNSLIWSFYPWSWSISTLTAINLTDGVQDYTPTDTNILRPVRLQLARTDTTPNEWRELALLSNLSPELTRKGGIDTITSIGWYPASNYFRLAMAASVGSGQTLQIQGVYQKLPTKIVAGNFSSVFAFPDCYFPVFVEGLLWQLYRLSDDPRAGQASYSKNGSMMRQYAGQYGVFMDALLSMARTEDLNAGDEFQYPESAVGQGRSYWPGLFGI